MSRPEGFLPAAPKSANGKPLTGRFVCPDIQWTGSGVDMLGTFTITAREVLAAAESNLLWTDQDVQRGVKPEHSSAPTELSLASGYPDPNVYIFVSENSDDIADKLLHDKQLFLSPLVWNLRPGKFEGHCNEDGDFHIYSGKIYLPDSHHRHQGLLKACRIYRDNPLDYPEFSLDKQFKVDLYFLSRQNEGDFFFDKNQRPRQTAKSKAFDLTTQDALSLLAKQIVSNSAALKGNVNRVTDRLTSKNAQVITLSTLREMSKSLVPDGDIDESEVDGLAIIAAGFYDMLADVRPELGVLDINSRKSVRDRSLVDSAVIMHGYAALMRDYVNSLTRLGTSKANSYWADRLRRLSSEKNYVDKNWAGDLFSKRNPMWTTAGILKPNSSGSGSSQVNNGATRSAAGRILRHIVQAEEAQFNINWIVSRNNA